MKLRMPSNGKEWRNTGLAISAAALVTAIAGLSMTKFRDIMTMVKVRPSASAQLDPENFVLYVGEGASRARVNAKLTDTSFEHSYLGTQEAILTYRIMSNRVCTDEEWAQALEMIEEKLGFKQIEPSIEESNTSLTVQFRSN